MLWTVCFICAMTALVISAASAAAASIRTGKKRVSPLKILMAGFFTAALAGLFPICLKNVNSAELAGFKSLFMSLILSAKVFVLSDLSFVYNGITSEDTSLSIPYTIMMSVIYMAAPLLSLGFVVSFFRNVSSYLNYILHFFSDVYVFSELNKRSAALGVNIRTEHPDAVIAYMNVSQNENNTYSDVLAKTRALCFGKTILSINFSRHSKKNKITFFAINNIESQNVTLSLDIIKKYKERLNTYLYIFSSQTEGSMVFDGNDDTGNVTVRRINETRSHIYDILYNSGPQIFKNAVTAEKGEYSVPLPNEKIPIGAVVVGLGRYGTQMLRSLSWYCQMDGFRISIDAFEKDPLAEDKFTAQCPELMSEIYSQEESEYFIRIHSGVDIDTGAFAEKMSEIKNLTYIFVSLGSDEVNIKAAAYLRMLAERMGKHPFIQAVVYSRDKIDALDSAKNFSEQKYDIDFLGDTDLFYSGNMIENSQLEKEALDVHLSYGGKPERFYKYEYDYRASVVAVLHMKAKQECGIVLDEQQAASLEHRRWNAYMRSEGYIYGSERNDLARVHPKLMPYEELQQEDITKNINIVSGKHNS